MRVADLVQQLLEDVVALDLTDAQQFGPLAVVQLVDGGSEVDQLGGVDVGRPPLSDRELQIRRDRIVVGVEQVLQIPPSHTDRAHIDAPRRWRQRVPYDRVRSGPSPNRVRSPRAALSAQPSSAASCSSRTRSRTY